MPAARGSQLSSKNQAKNWFKPGTGGNPNGRPKGIENKLNRSIKDMILTALNDVGGAAYLARQAEKNPVAFMGLVGRVLPLQLANADGSNPIVLHLFAARTVSDEITAERAEAPTLEAKAEVPSGNLLDAPLPTE